MQGQAFGTSGSQPGLNTNDYLDVALAFVRVDANDTHQLLSAYHEVRAHYGHDLAMAMVALILAQKHGMRYPADSCVAGLVRDFERTVRFGR